MTEKRSRKGEQQLKAGPERDEVARIMGAAYASGKSLRQIAGEIGRSYKYVQILVQESGVPMRSVGSGRSTPAPGRARSARKKDAA